MISHTRLWFEGRKKPRYHDSVDNAEL